MVVVLEDLECPYCPTPASIECNVDQEYAANHSRFLQRVVLDSLENHKYKPNLDFCGVYIDPAKHKSISSSFGVLLKEQRVGGFLFGPENASKCKTLIYLVGSASVEVFLEPCMIEAHRMEDKLLPSGVVIKLLQQAKEKREAKS
ncbi:hypothetical protein Pfo_019807 [Paulownia fortunei]|nr:hypothetical protein Pfo_019807 [Paulownia fortunei]